MPKEKQKRRSLTPDEVADARRLKQIYERKKQELGLTQEKLAALMGFNTQGSVSQYMSGHGIPMNNEIVIRFAHFLHVDAEEIRPDIWTRIPTRANPLELEDRAVVFAQAFADLSEEDKAFLEAALRRLGR